MTPLDPGRVTLAAMTILSTPLSRPTTSALLGRLLLAATLVNLLLIAPMWLRHGIEAGGWIAWEAWLLVGLFATLPPRRSVKALGWLAALVLIAGLVLALGDGATHRVLSRPLNLYFDTLLIGAGFHLLDGSLGRAGALAVTGAVVVTLVGLTLLLAGVLLRQPRPDRRARMAALGLAALGLAGLTLDQTGLYQLPGARSPVVDTLRFQAAQVASAHDERRAFLAAAPEQRQTGTPLPGLAGIDVLLVFVESYGMTVFEQEAYRAVIEPRLRSLEQRLDERGLAVVSGSMAAPIRGGQSWLSHASVLSGQRIGNQLWYRLLLGSNYNTLVDDFRATGHVSMAVKPAIVRPWPEGVQLGFDQIFAAPDLGYAGPALNWVTMPDQYTLHHFQQVLRPAVEAPLFAMLALISSHAPWTPVLEVLPDWEVIEDGRVFERWRNAGASPGSVWRSLSKLRDQYIRSLDYSLHAVLDYAARFADDHTLLIILGDHPPSALVSRTGDGPGVPVHLVSARPELLDGFARRGFVDGLLPPSGDRGNPALAPLEELRAWFRADFGASLPETSRSRP